TKVQPPCSCRRSRTGWAFRSCTTLNHVQQPANVCRRAAILDRLLGRGRGAEGGSSLLPLPLAEGPPPEGTTTSSGARHPGGVASSALSLHALILVFLLLVFMLLVFRGGVWGRGTRRPIFAT